MRIVGGVIVGLAIAIGLMIGTNVLLVKITVTSSVFYIAATLAGAAIYHLASGFVCATIARDAAAATWALVVLGTAVLLTSVRQTWTQMPEWYSLAMVVIVPVALWLGARAHALRGMHAAPAAR